MRGFQHVSHGVGQTFNLMRVECCGPSPKSKAFRFDDFDAEAGQSPKMMSRGCEMADRCDAQIPKDLRAYSDFAPLLVALASIEADDSMGTGGTPAAPSRRYTSTPLPLSLNRSSTTFILPEPAPRTCRVRCLACKRVSTFLPSAISP